MEERCVYPPRWKAAAGVNLVATVSCLVSVAFLLRGLIIEGPAFYNGQECTMTYSRFQFLPLRVSANPSNQKYRLLKFTDGRDPRHQHFYPIITGTQNSGQSSQQHDNGRELQLRDNWCLLTREEINDNSSHVDWTDVPHPHRGHPVLYVPGHWGSFSQSRSLGAHGTRWTGPYNNANFHKKIFESFRTGVGMHDGEHLLDGMENITNDEESITDLLLSQYHYGFVMDVFALDFGEEGTALHSSKIFNQADFIAKAIETLAEGCHLGDRSSGITVVAHSIGAWSVRASLDMNPQLVSKGWVKNIITLASPLQSIPYAVDSGVHDLVQTLNKRNANDVVAIISVSGGLRDELIPPTLSRGQSESFLASSILEAKATSSLDAKFGMDHRCIVWCFDLLTQIRSVIFTLAVSTGRGMNSSERRNIVRKTLMRTNQSTSFGDEVQILHERAVEMNGYASLIAIQLAAPYNLNCMLKLCILAGLIYSLLFRPLLLQSRTQYWTQKKSVLAVCTEVSITVLVIPSLVVVTALSRRLEIQIYNGSFRQCYMNECDLLLGTIFVLSQLATMVYFVVAYGVGFTSSKLNLSQPQYPSPGTFGSMIWYFTMRSMQFYLTACLPVAAGVFVITRRVSSMSEMVDITALVATCFVSWAILVLACLLKLILMPTATNLEERRLIIALLLISLVKSIHGKLIYAYSIMQRVHNQNGLNTNEFFLSFALSLPAFFTIFSVESHDIMAQHAMKEWKRSTESENTRAAVSWNKMNIIFFAVSICLVCWYMWNVLGNYSGEDAVVPLYSMLIVAMTYWKCQPLSADALNVYASIIDDELSFHCEVKDKDD